MTPAPVAYLRDAHEGEGDECLVPAAMGDPGAFPVYTADPLREHVGTMLLAMSNADNAGRNADVAGRARLDGVVRQAIKNVRRVYFNPPKERR